MSKLEIRDCEGAEDSLREALKRVKPDRQTKALAATKALRDQLSQHGSLRSPDKWNKEGDLPDGKKFYALKTTKAYSLRGYGFFAGKGEFWISHWVYKDFQKLKQQDIDRVHENWRKVTGAKK